ncbi:MAG: TonB-dependent receptor [Acidobacteriales bacterium]|nr:TonB-dependent receptor [Terriglobales bacterium]
MFAHAAVRFFPLLFLITPCLFTIASFAAATFQVRGSTETASGIAVSNADITLLSAQRKPVATTRSDGNGKFRLPNVAPGDYVLSVSAPGFSQRRELLTVRGDVNELRLVMSVRPVHEEVTVTANPGRADDAAGVSQPVNVINANEIEMRAKAVVAQAVAEEEGVALQRTSPTMAGVFVRGLTGNKVNVFVDGVRYSTGAQRGGVNTFLNLVESSNLEAIEILRGPNSAQYGSDALGGSVQFLTAMPTMGSATPLLRGRYSMIGTSGDASFGSNLMLSYGSQKFGVLTNLDGRRINRPRAGNGLDSHSSFTRFFGLPSDLFIDDRLPDTGFTQYGGLLKMNWSLSQNSQLTAHYSRSQQDGGKRYDQLLGGDGNLIADLRNLMLDLFYVRLDQQKLGWFDQGSVTYSFNSQREERVNQGGNGNPRATITHEYERTRVNGVQGYVGKQVARQDLLFGADYYHERDTAPSFGLNPVTGVSTVRRGRVPDQSKFESGGVYLQDVFTAIPEKLRLVGSVRYGAASYSSRSADSPLVGGAPLWPDDSLRADDVTFRAGVVGTPVESFSLSANISRGFRAPHITDLGTLGLTGSGFEVAAPDVAGLGATIGNSAAATAVSTGDPVVQVTPEISLNYEFGARYRHRIVETWISFFVNNIDDNIVKQALILPPGAVGLSLGGQPITSQSPTGTVFVPASTNPVLVRANFDDVRLWGIEHRARANFGPRWSAQTIFTYLHARDIRTDLPPNIEGGTPAPDGYLSLRYSDPRGNWWIEPYMHLAGRQDRLSSLDLEDRRTGATRTRSSIQNFFRNGATARGLVSPGLDGIFGNGDDVLLATGETLAQIQNRVLGPGVNSSPLFTAVPGYVTVNLRGGMRLGERHRIIADFENIGDRNYRGISWGLDASGRSLSLQYALSF